MCSWLEPLLNAPSFLFERIDRYELTSHMIICQIFVRSAFFIVTLSHHCEDKFRLKIRKRKIGGAKLHYYLLILLLSYSISCIKHIIDAIQNELYLIFYNSTPIFVRQTVCFIQCAYTSKVIALWGFMCLLIKIRFSRRVRTWSVWRVRLYHIAETADSTLIASYTSIRLLENFSRSPYFEYFSANLKKKWLSWTPKYSVLYWYLDPETLFSD